MKKFKYMMVVSVALVLSSASAFAVESKGPCPAEKGGTINDPTKPDTTTSAAPAAQAPTSGAAVVPTPETPKK